MKYLVVVLLLISTPCYALNLTQSCLAFYKMDDKVASKIVKDERTDNTGTGIRNTVLYNAVGKIGEALDFDGADDKVDCGSDFIGQRPITICAWIYPEGWGEGGFGRIVDNSKVLFYTVNGRFSFSSDGGTTTANAAASSLSLNTWQFVCATRTSAGAVNLYVDGALSSTADQPSGTPAGGTNVLVGNSSGDDRTFNGSIDNLMIFSRVLRLDEIIRLYNGGRGIGSLSMSEVIENGIK